jgi:muramoyltetrapeptide carboxypeptidase LdcA involved in peptidoglycan recycling
MSIPFLNPGETIGLFSPASAVTAWAPQRTACGIRFLESKGFRVKAGSLTGCQDAWRSGTAEARAAELNALLRDPDVRCVMSTIGGCNANALLPFLDYDAFRRDPKPVIGYSDVTAILFGLYARTGIGTFHGPSLATSFGEFPPLVDETWDSFADVVMGRAPRPLTYPRPAGWTDELLDWESQDRPKETQPNAWITLRSGRVCGRLLAGNLNTLSGIWGTPFMPEIRIGDVWLIEDCKKTAAETERAFTHLALAGVFDRIGGLILGKHARFDDQKSGRKAHEILDDVLRIHRSSLAAAGPFQRYREIPVLAEFDSCHTHPLLTLPIGAEVELDATEQRLVLIADA